MECCVCSKDIESNRFLLIPLCTNNKIKIFCHDCCVSLLSKFLGEHVDEEYKVKVELPRLSSETKTKSAFEIMVDVLVALCAEYKLTWYEILSAISMLQMKALSLYIKDLHEYAAQKILYEYLYKDMLSSSTTSSSASDPTSSSSSTPLPLSSDFDEPYR